MQQVFSRSQVRNVALAGHGHAGKTSLTAALLHATGVTPRFLRVDEGNTITDCDEEEIARRISISSAIAACTWKQIKINLIDTPGFNAFLHDTQAALSAADAVAIVIDALSGIGVVTHKIWKFAEDLGLPVFFVINKLDRERASFTEVCAAVQEAWGKSAVPVQLPVMSANGLAGILDLIHMRGIPEHMTQEAQSAHERVVEAVAEGDDQSLEEFFATGTIGIDHLISGLREEMRGRRIFPILCASAAKNVGTELIADFMTECVPASAGTAKAGASLFVFKTTCDAAAGRVTYFKVMSGCLKDDAHLMNLRTRTDERLAHLSVPFGKKLQPVSVLQEGDIGAVSRLKDTLTFDTLSHDSSATPYPRLQLPEPSIAYAIFLRNGRDETRLSSALARLLEEDCALRFYRDGQTQEFLLAGTGRQHLEVVVSRLKRRYDVDVELKSPKIAYRETIRSSATAQGRHKKQSGGHGQFGDCHIRLEPLPRGQGFEFHNAVFGGAIPKQFIPAVEKGIQEAAATGYLAGYPVVDFRVTLLDGSYHDVDSSEMAFKLAGRKAFRAAMEAAKPVLLEPVMQVNVEAPGEFAGDLLSDFSSRRGRVGGTDVNGGTHLISAHVPLTEMLTYGEDITSLTQGRAAFHMEFDHYDLVPQAHAQPVIEKFKAGRHGEDQE